MRSWCPRAVPCWNHVGCRYSSRHARILQVVVLHIAHCPESPTAQLVVSVLVVVPLPHAASAMHGHEMRTASTADSPPFLYSTASVSSQPWSNPLCGSFSKRVRSLS